MICGRSRTFPRSAPFNSKPSWIDELVARTSDCASIRWPRRALIATYDHSGSDITGTIVSQNLIEIPLIGPADFYAKARHAEELPDRLAAIDQLGRTPTELTRQSCESAWAASEGQ